MHARRGRAHLGIADLHEAMSDARQAAARQLQQVPLPGLQAGQPGLRALLCSKCCQCCSYEAPRPGARSDHNSLVDHDPVRMQPTCMTSSHRAYLYPLILAPTVK